MNGTIATRRILDLVVATLLVLVTAPLMLVIGVVIRIGNGRPVVFGQQRLGQRGVAFRLHKFRTLEHPIGPAVTPTGDPRITGIGRLLRRTHLDELPQLFDVLRGRMALVGPRPEVPDNLEYVDDAALAAIHAVRPGLTGPIQLAFLAEDDVLAEEPDPVAPYRRVLVPAKVAENRRWLATRSLGGDVAVLLRTPLVLLSPAARRRSRARVERLLGRRT